MNFTNWIWLPADMFPTVQRARVTPFCRGVGVQPALAVFRRTVPLAPGFRKIFARWAGEPRFRLFINGRFVDDGPTEPGGDYDCRDGCDWLFGDTRDLTAYFHPGNNVVSAEVFTVGLAQTDYSGGRPGFFFEAESDGRRLLRTGCDWKCLLNHAADQYPPAWHEENGVRGCHAPDFDEAQLAFAEEIPPQAFAGRRLIESTIPPLTNVPVRPAAVEDGNGERCEPGRIDWEIHVPTAFVLDFAEELAGHFELEFDASEPVGLRIEYQEIKGIAQETEIFTAPAGRHRFRSPRLHAFQFIRLVFEHRGFALRPLRLTIHAATAFRRGFPLPETTTFTCSDPELEHIRRCCDRTLRLCMQRLHLDSPVHQEGLGCTGDYMIEALMSYYLYGEYRLAREDLRRTTYFLQQHEGKMFHTSYSLLYIWMLHDYWRYSGDAETVGACFPGVHAVLARFKEYSGSEGLISQAPNYMFIDWVEINGDSFHHPPAARGMGVMTAFYYKSLRLARKMALMLHDSESAEIWRTEAETVFQAFNAELWVESNGCYRDGVPGLCRQKNSQWRPPDRPENGFSPHTQIAALACGLVPEDRKAALLERVMTDQAWEIPQMYFTHFLFDALEECHAFDRFGFDLLKRWGPVCAAHPASLKEAWFGGDCCHAWGGTPAIQIARQILGIRPTAPGFEKITFAPCFGALRRVHGCIRTPRGEITVDFDETGVRLSLPEGISVE